MASYLRKLTRFGSHINSGGHKIGFARRFLASHDDDHLPPLILETQNGSKEPGAFSAREMERRLNVLRTHMQERDIEAVVLTSYHNVNYFSGFLYVAFGRPYGMVITMDKCTTISANIDGGQPWRRTLIGDNILYTDWQKDNYFKAIKHLLPNCGGTVACEFDDINLQSFKKLESVLPDSPKVDIGDATMYMRMIKSQEEIELIKHGARTANVGGRACMAAIGENVPENIVAQHSTKAMENEIATTFPDLELRDTWTWFQSGINTDGAHNSNTSRRIQKGDILSLNCFPMISGYYTALERTLFCDYASDRHIELWDLNCDVHRKGSNLIKPGIRCCDIAQELNEIYRQHGLLKYRSFGYGHSFGSLCHYYGREAGLEIREDVPTVLEPNMVVSMEPMIMIPEGQEGAGGYREHDIFVVTENGAENITNFPFGKEEMIIKN